VTPEVGEVLVLGKVMKFSMLSVLAVAVAVGIGYLYTIQAALVWGLLFLCWACYRLRLRAVALFGPRDIRRSARATDPDSSGLELR
jgi:uncharacterized membrane protein